MLRVWAQCDTQPGCGLHPGSASTWEAEAGRSEVKGQPQVLDKPGWLGDPVSEREKQAFNFWQSLGFFPLCVYSIQPPTLGVSCFQRRFWPVLSCCCVDLGADSFILPLVLTPFVERCPHWIISAHFCVYFRTCDSIPSICMLVLYISLNIFDNCGLYHVLKLAKVHSFSRLVLAILSGFLAILYEF